MDWFLYDNGLRHERVKYHPEIPLRKYKVRNSQWTCSGKRCFYKFRRIQGKTHLPEFLFSTSVKWNMRNMVLFGPVTLGDINKEIKNINFKKSWISNGILPGILKMWISVR